MALKSHKSILQLFLLLLCFCFSSSFSTLEAAKPKKTKYYLAMTSMFKNEAKWMKEWIEYYKLLGVEHFYLYNNLSTDNYLEVLQPYIEEGTVTLKDWKKTVSSPKEHNRNQNEAMEDCLKNCSCKWLMMNDLDEFVFPCQEENGDLPTFLRKYDNMPHVGALFINWYLYGTSFVDEIPADKLMIETLTLRGETMDTTGKVIIQPARVDGIPSIHYPRMKFGYAGIYADGYPAKNFFQDSHVCEGLIRINHYWSRDYKNFIEKKVPTGQTYIEHARNQEFTNGFITERFNKVEDTEILRYVPELRKRMGFENRVPEVPIIEEIILEPEALEFVVVE